MVGKENFAPQRHGNRQHNLHDLHHLGIHCRLIVLVSFLMKTFDILQTYLLKVVYNILLTYTSLYLFLILYTQLSVPGVVYCICSPRPAIPFSQDSRPVEFKLQVKKNISVKPNI